MVNDLPVRPELRYQDDVAFHLVAKDMRLIVKRPRRIFGFIIDCLDPRVGSDFEWSDLRPFWAVLKQGLW